MSRVRLHRLDHALLILAVSAGCERSDPLTAPPRVLAPHAALGVPIIVTKTSDDGSPGTLRHSIQTATSEDVIQFDPSIAGQTITLTQELVLEAVKRTIEGPVARGITINANATGRVFFLSSGAELTLSNVTITGSRALPGIALSNSKLTLSNSTMSDNVSLFSGGAIASFASTVTIINSTISGNHADENGGGIYTGLGSTTEIIYSTISNNSAGGQGGGLWNAGFTKLRSTIIAGNTASDRIACGGEIGSSMELSGKNLSDSYYCTEDENLVTNPRLGPLADNGGPTKTHALLIDSPAINAATNCTVTEDQRHIARPQPVGGACDIGAFEFTDFRRIAVTVDASISVNPNNGIAVVTGSMTCPLPGPVTLRATVGQPQKSGRVSIEVTASASTVVECTGTTPWAVLLAPINGAFTNGTGSASVMLESTDPMPLPASLDKSVKLHWGHK